MADSSKRKGSVYVDGHERPDVVRYRKSFAARWTTKFIPRMAIYGGDDMNEKRMLEFGNEKDKKIVLVTYDECIFQSNDNKKYARLASNEQILTPKSGGRGLMISDFLCPCHGSLKDLESHDPVRILLRFGKVCDGY